MADLWSKMTPPKIGAVFQLKRSDYEPVEENLASDDTFDVTIVPSYI